MRIKLDENLPFGLQLALIRLGHDVDTVLDEQLAGRDDDEVWRAAQVAGRFFITQDLDFSDIRRFEPGTHAGILLIPLREPKRRALQDRVRELFEHENVAALAGCFVVATEHKLRVRKPD